jgi:ketosteroid isomerase-like protein
MYTFVHHRLLQEPKIMDKSFIESYYATYNEENPDALRKFYADDVILASAMGELHGPDAILATYTGLTSQCHDKMTPLTIDIDGNRAIVAIRDVFTAKHDLADFMGQPLKKGESFQLNLRGTYTEADGKFTRILIESL